MKKILTNLVLTIIVCQIAVSQSDFRKGYIVKNNGDTLHGWVNFQKEAQNNSVCNFKRFEIALPINYSPEKLKAYGIDGGKQYLAAEFNGRKVFVEYLVKGKLSLLYLNKGSEHYFTLTGDGTLVELKSGRTADASSNQTYNHYKEYLEAAFKPIQMSESIQKSKLEINSLTALIKQYNEASNSEFEIPVRPKEKSILKDYSILGTRKIQFGLLGGVSMNSFAIKTDESSYQFMEKAKFNTVTSPTFGIFVKGNFTRSIPKLSLQANVLYHKASLYGFANYKNSNYSSDLMYDDIFIDFEEIKTQGTLNYSFKKQNLTLLPHIGIGYAYRLSSSYKRFHEEYSTTYNIVKSYEYSDLPISNASLYYIGGVTFEYSLSSARVLILNIDYNVKNKVLERQSQRNTDQGLKGFGSEFIITLGLAL